jgi:hypothetical protein
MCSAGKKTRPVKIISFVFSSHCIAPDVSPTGNQGKDALQRLVREHKEEYYTLSKDKRADLLKEYAEWSSTKATGVRTSTKSKVNDITQTLKAVEIEVCVPPSEFSLAHTCV